MERKNIWKRKIRDWENSGLTRAEYCRREKIPLSTFDYWKKRIRTESISNSKTNLVKLPVVLKSSQDTSFSIECPSGHKIMIPGDYDTRSLIRLMTDLMEILK